MNLLALALAVRVAGAKLAHGLAQILPPEDLTILVNTGDDFERIGDPKGFFRQPSPCLAGQSCETERLIAGKTFRERFLSRFGFMKIWQKPILDTDPSADNTDF